MTGWHSNQKTSSPEEFMCLWKAGGGVYNVKGSALKIKVIVPHLFCYKSLCTIFLVG